MCLYRHEECERVPRADTGMGRERISMPGSIFVWIHQAHECMPLL